MDCWFLGVREEERGQEPAHGSLPFEQNGESEDSLFSRPHTELELSRHDHAGEPPEVL
jgi:hypothetical protein